MSDLFITKLRLLFEINAARQAEMDELFLSMSNYPSDGQLTLLHDTVEHSVPEAKALLHAINKVMNRQKYHIPDDLIGNVLLQRIVLQEQIENDRGLTAYLEHEYEFLSPFPKV